MPFLSLAGSDSNAYLQKAEKEEEERKRCPDGVGPVPADGAFLGEGDAQ